MTTKQIEAWRPNRELDLLIRIAFAENEQARCAWEEWSSTANLARLEQASVRLLPLIYRRSGKLGVEGPAMALIGKSYRHTWANNASILRVAEKLVADLGAAGIPTILFKGLAMVAHYYPDAGMRSMADFDIAIPGEYCDAAIDVFVESGWHPYGRPLEKLSGRYRTALHAYAFLHEKTHKNCDLHWHLSSLFLHQRFDEPFWQAAIPIQLGSVKTQVLSPTDQIVHSGFNGIRGEFGHNIRWLPDVLMVLSRHPEVDWDRFVALSQLLEVTMPMAGLLGYLRSDWNIEVPDSAIHALEQTPISRHTRLLNKSTMTYYWQRSPWQMLRFRYGQYLSTNPQGPQWVRPLGFLGFLQRSWLVDLTSGGVPRIARGLHNLRHLRTAFPKGYPQHDDSL